MLKSYKSTIVGILSLTFAAIAGSQHHSILEALMDMQVQMAILIGALGMVTKDFDVHATTEVKVEPQLPPKPAITTIEVKE